jgi:hypothetical protein
MNQADVLHFLEQLGRRYDRQAELHLIGGAALCLFGSPRATLDVDFVGNDLPNAEERAPGTFRAVMEDLADELHIEIEAVPLEQFIPLPPDADTRHQFVGEFGSVRVFMFDPYSIALSKLDRGLPGDMQDILFLVRQGLIESATLATIVEQALTRAVEFNLDRTEIQERLAQLRRTWEGS